MDVADAVEEVVEEGHRGPNLDKSVLSKMIKNCFKTKVMETIDLKAHQEKADKIIRVTLMTSSSDRK